MRRRLDVEEENIRLRNENEKLKHMLISEIPDMIVELNTALKSRGAASWAGSELEVPRALHVAPAQPVIDPMGKNYSIEDVVKMFIDGRSSDMEESEDPEEDSVEDKGWTPTSKDVEEDSACSDEDKDDESSDQTDVDDTTTNAPAGDERKRRGHQWKKKRFDPPDVTFDGFVEEDKERLNWTPYMYFKYFVNNHMLEEIAEQTNLYSLQKEGTSLDTTANEIEKVLGMYLHMGLVQMPNVRAFWEMETEYSPVSDVMSRSRFLKLLTMIHFQDNFGVSDDAQKDKLWKLRPWLTKLRAQFLSVPPEECHAVGEITVPFRGKTNPRVQRPAKPHKWGFKMWGRAGQSGYLYDFDICQGAVEHHEENSDVGASEDVVLKMTSTLQSGKNHKVFANDAFTSVPLVECLKERGIYYIGTIGTNRVRDGSMMQEKELKTKERGSVDARVNQDNLIIVRWNDNKPVNLLSSYVGIEPMGSVKLWDRKSKTYTVVPRPAIAETYNKFRRGIDLLDMLSALYKFNLRSRRWYMNIWWHTVTVAVINAWNFYRRDQETLRSGEKSMPLRRFQAAVGNSLTSAGKAWMMSGRPLSPPPRKRPRTRVPPDVRKDGIDHVPTWECRQRCKHCTGNHFTHVYCEKCKVHLCLNKDRNCFQGHHAAE